MTNNKIVLMRSWLKKVKLPVLTTIRNFQSLNKTKHPETQIDNLTLCISTLPRIGFFRPAGPPLQKNGTKTHNELPFSMIAKSLHFKQHSNSPFLAGKCRKMHPRLPFLACGSCLPRVVRNRRTRHKQPFPRDINKPFHAWQVP